MRFAALEKELAKQIATSAKIGYTNFPSSMSKEALYLSDSGGFGLEKRKYRTETPPFPFLGVTGRIAVSFSMGTLFCPKVDRLRYLCKSGVQQGMFAQVQL